MMSEKPTRHISPQKKREDQGLDAPIRPQLLQDFTGQDRLKANLKILIEAALARQEPLDHVLF
ncbi:MAG: Holliday junction branch migration DNA helicase RuvB, partial [Anaerolineales bacterium]|nr:Holliday junction branch migration DNA helicase RuvB [Anaerolineales bacterium]